MWAGLPVLTCAGEAFASRVAASLLNAIQLPELITTTQQDYESLAIELAANPAQLENLKHKLEKNRLISMRLPQHMISELKEIAAAKGFSGYQGLIRYYVSQGARKDIAELDMPKLDNIAKVLKAQGVPKKVIAQALQAA